MAITSSVPPTFAPPVMCDDYPIDELVRDDVRYQYRACPTVTLDNAVSPIFTRERLTNIDFDAFLPVMQMLTLAIETPCLMGAWSATCLSEPQEVKYTDRAGTYRAVFRQPEPLSPQQVDAIKQHFATLAPYLTFEHGEMPREGVQALTRTMDEKVPFKGFAVSSMGNASKIIIPSDKYNELLGDIQAVKNDPMSWHKQKYLFNNYFGLAISILHELGHAVDIGRFGRKDRVCMPFECRTASEDGFDVESVLFGGAVFAHNNVSYGKAWPSAEAVESYLRRRGGETEVTASLESVTGAGHVNLWKIPSCFVRAFFQKDFYQTVVPSMGAAAFKMPRLLGWRLAPRYELKRSSCRCDSCLLMREFVIRCLRRGNRPLAKQGAYCEELIQHEIRRMANSREHDRRHGRPYDAPDATELQAFKHHVRELMKSRPDEHTERSMDCFGPSWTIWMGPRDAYDTRKVRSFGIPKGFKSCSDGTVVAAEHYKEVIAHQDELCRSWNTDWPVVGSVP